MAMYSSKNVRQLYVANKYSSAASAPGAYVGTVTVDGGKAFHLKFTNVDGIPMLSDKISLDKIRHIKASSYTPKVYREDKITIGDPIVGQEYIIAVNFRNWGSGSVENTYYKHIGAYKAKTGDTNVTLVDKFVELGNANFARETYPYLSFAKEAVTNKLVITEQPHPWELGKMEGHSLHYDFKVLPIVSSGVETNAWATFATTYGKPGTGTYEQAADLEYFYMGERADKLGYANWPLNFPTKYLVEPGANYNIIDIAYYAQGDSHSVQAAEKQLLILCKVNSGVAVELIDDINTIKASLINVIADAIPGIITTPVSTVAFDDTAANSTDTVTLNIKGVGLTEDITILISGADFATAAYTVAKADALATAGKNVTLTFAPTTAGDKVGSLVLQSGSFSKTLVLEGTAT